MGLDQYLVGKIYIGANYEHNNAKGEIKISINGKPIDIPLNKITYIELNMGYWRKANSIHAFFVNEVQEGEDDCKQYYVGWETLEKLRDICNRILNESIVEEGFIKNGESLVNGEWEPNLEMGKYIVNTELAEKLLPTQSGFFFGSTDYDEYYIQDLKDTIEIIKECEKYKDNYEFYYESSW